MERLIPVDSCAEDSPYFRSSVSFWEESVDDLEFRMSRIAAICRERNALWQRDSALSQELCGLLDGFVDRHIPEEAQSSNRQSFADNETVRACIDQVTSCLSQLDDHRERLHEQVRTCVTEPFERFGVDRIQQVRVAGRAYRDANTEASGAVDRFCSCKRHELSAMADLSSSLYEARLRQHDCAVKYATSLNNLHADKANVLGRHVLDLLTCELTNVRLGNSVFEGVDATLADTFSQLKNIAKDVEESHAREEQLCIEVMATTRDCRLQQLEAFQKNDLHLPAGTAAANVARLQAIANRRMGVLTEQVRLGRKSSGTSINVSQPKRESVLLLAKGGYLYHGEHRPVVGLSWRRQYFQITDGWLRTLSESEALQLQFPDSVPPSSVIANKHTVSVDLRLCLVKPGDSDRCFTFRVIHPNQTLLLQAESSAEMNEWIAALQSAAVHAFDDSKPSGPTGRSRSAHCTPSPSPNLPRTSSSNHLTPGLSVANSSSTSGLDKLDIIVEEVLAIEGNNVCADCGAKGPKWASVNLGVVLCIECSGVHRSLGVHISQVRSLTLDMLRDEWIRMLTETGNSRSNVQFEAQLPKGFSRRSAIESDRTDFIRRKYIDLAFANDDFRQCMLAIRSQEKEARMTKQRALSADSTQQVASDVSASVALNSLCLKSSSATANLVVPVISPTSPPASPSSSVLSKVSRSIAKVRKS